MVREIRGAKINLKSSFKKRVGKIGGGGNYASKYGIFQDIIFSTRMLTATHVKGMAKQSDIGTDKQMKQKK